MFGVQETKVLVRSLVDWITEVEGKQRATPRNMHVDHPIRFFIPLIPNFHLLPLDCWTPRSGKKKIRKIPVIHLDPRPSFTSLYCVFTLFYSGITPAFLGCSKIVPYVTQTDFLKMNKKRKKTNSSWIVLEGCLLSFFLNQWKGEGMDGGIRPRTGAGDREF